MKPYVHKRFPKCSSLHPKMFMYDTLWHKDKCNISEYTCIHDGKCKKRRKNRSDYNVKYSIIDFVVIAA